jgi:Fe-S cluster assembly protein SufB
VILRGRISRGLVEEISRIKREPEWMLRLRLRALELFESLPTPQWLRGVEDLDLDQISAYVSSGSPRAESWSELPDYMRKYYERLGIPELEARFLSGLTAVLDSETVYSRMKEYLEKLGVILLPMEEAVQRYPDLVREHFSRVFPPSDHKFAALHTALWSGGAFVYVPKGVRVPQPIEAYFIIGGSLEGQFEHTLIVADEGSELTFIEGCSAPMLKNYSFHDGMVEIHALRGSRVKFITVQNWSRNVINFNNKRAIAEEGATVEWVEGSIGSRVTYTYPSTILRGRGSRTSNVVVGIANGPYLKDTGSKVIHAAPDTRSSIVSKNISNGGGVNVYRGLVRMLRGATNSVSHVECSSLIMDKASKAHTYPHVQLEEPTASASHEATTSRLTEDQLFYLRSRGLKEGEAKSLIVLGFLQDVMQDLPIEYVSVLTKVMQVEFSEVGGLGRDPRRGTRVPEDLGLPHRQALHRLERVRALLIRCLPVLGGWLLLSSRGGCPDRGDAAGLPDAGS